MVRLESVVKGYPGSGRCILNGLDLAIDSGSFVFLTGPSGAGKTTLINLITGAEMPSRGRVLVAGHDLGRLSSRGLAQVRQNLGVVFQDFRLLPRRSVYQNVALALVVKGRRHRRDLPRLVGSALASVGLEDMSAVRTDTLSGGEQQRVAIARALVRRPAMVLADEPTGNLDPQNTERVIRLLSRANQAGVTVVLATHDPTLPGKVPGAMVLGLLGGSLERLR